MFSVTSLFQLFNGDRHEEDEKAPIKAIVNKQYNSPVAMYSDESIAETLSAQAEVLAGGVLGYVPEEINLLISKRRNANGRFPKDIFYQKTTGTERRFSISSRITFFVGPCGTIFCHVYKLRSFPLQFVYLFGVF